MPVEVSIETGTDGRDADRGEEREGESSGGKGVELGRLRVERGKKGVDRRGGRVGEESSSTEWK